MDSSLPMAGAAPGFALKPSLRSALLIAGKGAVSIGLLAILALRVDWSGVPARLASADPLLLCLAGLAIAIATLIAGLRWQRLLRHLGLAVGRAVAIRMTFAAWFVSQFLPGTLGGDSARLFFLWRAGYPLREGLQSVLLDRIVALVGVLLLIVLSLPRLFAFQSHAMAWASTFTTILAAAAGGLVFLAIRIPDWARRGRAVRFVAFVGEFRRSLRSRAALLAIGLSVLMHLLSIASVVLIAGALGVKLPFGDAVGIVSAATLLSAVPISINGWGLREGAFVAGFSLLGISEQNALMISVIYGLCIMVSVSPGSFFFFTGARR